MTYIDREAFLASKVFLVAGTLDDYDQGYMDGVDAVEEVAKEFPAADVCPVVHGEWKECDMYESSWECSACGEMWTLIEGTPTHNGLKFCPNCGAQMEVEE